MEKAKYLFGDIVIVDDITIGVIVKTWENSKDNSFYYEIYVRTENVIRDFKEKDVERLRVRHKYLEGDDLIYQNK